MQDHFGHSIMQRIGYGMATGIVQIFGAAKQTPSYPQPVRNAALYAVNLRQAAVVRNVSGFAGPR